MRKNHPQLRSNITPCHKQEHGSGDKKRIFWALPRHDNQIHVIQARVSLKSRIAMINLTMFHSACFLIAHSEYPIVLSQSRSMIAMRLQKEELNSCRILQVGMGDIRGNPSLERVPGEHEGIILDSAKVVFLTYSRHFRLRR